MEHQNHIFIIPEFKWFTVEYLWVRAKLLRYGLWCQLKSWRKNIYSRKYSFLSNLLRPSFTRHKLSVIPALEEKLTFFFFTTILCIKRILNIAYIFLLEALFLKLCNKLTQRNISHNELLLLLFLILFWFLFLELSWDDICLVSTSCGSPPWIFDAVLPKMQRSPT